MATSGLDLVIVEGIVRILLMLRFFLINDIYMTNISRCQSILQTRH